MSDSLYEAALRDTIRPRAKGILQFGHSNLTRDGQSQSVKSGRKLLDDDYESANKNDKGKERKSGVSLDFEFSNMKFTKGMTMKEKGKVIERMNAAEKPLRKKIEMKNNYHKEIELDLAKRLSRTNNPDTSTLLFNDEEARLMHDTLPCYFHN